ncbi:SOS response-associated peptidase [Haloplanus rallus]|jgi:putative SOS response-associated peptidase YedK|uniref:SOS response-associated peptidase n=1 Tax=Haloplanus rallus TaxID=1816183 RepID=A0A6B9FDU2_9EURY|nr:SOS response-associated peptidase [Haloplanus rallus]QGX94319.1 SOS response-associated peptidase [Haloplanus rallus]
MCGRYTLFTPAEELADRFDVDVEWEPRYNCAPGQALPVVTPGADRMRTQQWGLIPSWADEASTDLINARAETITEKPSFADAFERRRCLVPADGFYEWVDRSAGKRPYRVAFEDDRPFAMAGIWSRWEPPSRQTGLGEFGTGDVSADPDPVESFAVVTTEPNELVSDLHHRMAVILDREAESTWLHGSVEEAAALLEPYPAAEMETHPVSQRVNDPRNDAPDLIEPAEA